MKIKFIILSILVSTLFLACGSDGNPNDTTEGKSSPAPTNSKGEIIKPQETGCKYSADNNGVNVNWTAFKTSKKVAVGGTFDDVKVESKAGVTSIAQLITGTTFKIMTNSVNSNKPDRDKKLVDFFFGKFVSTTDISGLFKSCNGDNAGGKGAMNLTMNGVSKDISFVYNVSDTHIEITTLVDTYLWNGQNAIASINKACEKLHAGDDGVSVTWKDVEVKVMVPLSKDCK